MGCAGSKPHTNQNNVNSPQKGFIIFNEKTIEYIKANENELRKLIRERCEPKLFTSNTGTAKKKVSNNNTNNKEQSQAKPQATPEQNKCLDMAIDSVLKYACNDFDIDNFKSSNHLSMKQIRKDIMKKSDATNLKQVQDVAFYKKALNTAIDEFGVVIQGKFTDINDFKPAVEQNVVVVNGDDTHKEDKDEAVNVSTNEVEEPQNVSESSLSLKEALELARQNFYKGKMSMVCVTKMGGYVVKEINDNAQAGEQEVVQQQQEPQEDVVNTTNASENLVPVEVSTTEPTTVTIYDSETRKTSKVAIESQIVIEDADVSEKCKIVEHAESTPVVAPEAPVAPATPVVSDKDSKSSPKKSSTLSSDKSSSKNSSKDELKRQKKEQKRQKEEERKAKELEEKNKRKAKEEEEKRVKEEQRKAKELEKQQKKAKEEEEKRQKKLKEAEKLNNKNKKDSTSKKEEVVTSQTSPESVVHVETQAVKEAPQVPEVIINAVLPQTNEDVQKVEVNNVAAVAQQDSPTEIKIVEEVVEYDEEGNRVDIKKEIAFSILNVGEVLAKTIDHYSIENEQDGNKDSKAESGVVTDTPVTPTTTPVNEQNEITMNGVNHDNQQNDESVTSPSDLVSSTSSSLQSTPQKKDNVQDDMAYLVREAEHTLSTHLDYFSDPKVIRTEEDDGQTHIVREYVTAIIENATEKLQTENVEGDVTNKIECHVIHTTTTTTVTTNGVTRRISIDEEILEKLDDVDKKVKYLNETCSENDDDDDDDDVNDDTFDDNSNQLRIDPNSNNLQEEMKHISNVLQDLVQSLNGNDTQTQQQDDELTTRKRSERKSTSSIGSSSNIPVRLTTKIVNNDVSATTTTTTTTTTTENDVPATNGKKNKKNKNNTKSKLPVKK